MREAAEVGTTHQGTPRPPGASRLVAVPLEPPSGTSLSHPVSFGPEKFSKNFSVFGLCLVLIYCVVKNMQKTATGTWHYVNRLVPKNDIKGL